MSLIIYGLKNCDSTRKALKVGGDKSPRLHDLRQDGLTKSMLKTWMTQIPLAKLLNKKSTTWRTLSDAEKNVNDDASIIALMLKHPTLVKRPICDENGIISIGLK